MLELLKSRQVVYFGYHLPYKCYVNYYYVKLDYESFLFFFCLMGPAVIVLTLSIGDRQVSAHLSSTDTSGFSLFKTYPAGPSWSKLC